jgi:hypothetical protein
MFVDTSVVKKFEGEEIYDMLAIASTLFDVSFKGAECSVLEAEIIKSCDSCNLKYLCKKIDEVVDDFTKKTTRVTESFSFNN